MTTAQKSDFLCHHWRLRDIWYWCNSCAQLACRRNLLRSLLNLSLAVDGWECCFGVKLQPLSQGLPDLLCVCQHTHTHHRELIPSCTAYNMKPKQPCNGQELLVLITGLALFAPLGYDIPFSESLRGCDPMQIDRLSSSSSGGRLRSSHTHLALTPLRLEPSVSMPWSTLSCLEEQEIYAIINTSSSKGTLWKRSKCCMKMLQPTGGAKYWR